MNNKILQFKARPPSGYVNVNGDPVGINLKALVREYVPDAICHRQRSNDHRGEIDTFTIHTTFQARGKPPRDIVIGTGGTEEEAWRYAYSMLVEAP